MSTIHKEWLAYKHAVYPLGVDQVQAQESCKAFHAGATVALLLAAEAAASVNEEQGEAAIDSLVAECEAFSRGQGDKP